MPKKLAAALLEEVSAGTHHEPHAVLGAHKEADGLTVRVLRPLANTVSIETLDGTFEAAHE